MLRDYPGVPGSNNFRPLRMDHSQASTVQRYEKYQMPFRRSNIFHLFFGYIGFGISSNLVELGLASEFKECTWWELRIQTDVKISLRINGGVVTAQCCRQLGDVQFGGVCSHGSQVP